MPVYSEVLSDCEIVDLIGKKYNSILIVGCGACMNESLSFKHNIPIFVKDELKNKIPYAVTQEVIRISKMLNSKGYDTRVEVFPEGSNSRCMINNTAPKYILCLEPKPDAILALSCPSGVFGMESMIKDIPIIKITKQKGFLAYNYIEKEDGSTIMILEKSKIL